MLLSPAYRPLEISSLESERVWLPETVGSIPCLVLLLVEATPRAMQIRCWMHRGFHMGRIERSQWAFFSCLQEGVDRPSSDGCSFPWPRSTWRIGSIYGKEYSIRFVPTLTPCGWGGHPSTLNGTTPTGRPGHPLVRPVRPRFPPYHSGNHTHDEEHIGHKLPAESPQPKAAQGHE